MDSTRYYGGRLQRSIDEEIEVTAVRGPVDLPFMLLTLLLLAFGLIMVFSASYASSLYETGNATHLFFKQAIFGVSGVLIMFVVSFLDYRRLRSFAVPLLIFSVLCLIVVLIPIPGVSVKVGGARRWINFFGITNFQPSEIAKLAVIMTFSSMICTFKEKMKTFRYGILPFVIILGVLAALMVLEPHLSGTILIVAAGGALMFVGGVKWGWFAAVLGFGFVAAAVIMKVMPHAQKRLATWQDPFSDPTGTGWQIIQSLYAIGSGGLFGLGLGKSRQKYLYLPEEHNDFIFAIVCEELGYIGAFIILLLFALLIIRGYWLAIHARDRYGSLLITGIITLFAIQTFFNVAVVTNLIPVTGVSLPFFSYGGTSLMIQLFEMGIILSVSRRIPAPKSG